MGRGGKRPGAGRKPNGLKRLVIRACDLARLSPEEIQLLDCIAQKIAAPLPDTRRNQKESKPAIEAEVVASGAIEASALLLGHGFRLGSGTSTTGGGNAVFCSGAGCSGFGDLRSILLAVLLVAP